MHYEVKIDEFEGPLDLLLHLIKKSNIDIYDISLEEITNQYLDYIKAMKEMNLDIASEYLVMASELLEYKSKSLLPKKEEESDEYEEDPKETLIKKLIDYKKYKEITSAFKDLESVRSDIFTKTPSSIDEYDEKIINNDEVSVEDLLEAFKKFMTRKEFEKPLNTKITNKELSVSERIGSIRNLLKTKKQINFMDLFEVHTKDYIVVTFLSILEMSKDNEITIEQNDNFGNIIIKGVK
ncbi:MAG: segregation/condensation protein A [Bacilli bacterium]|nr:segregation/condensation protein A [Bacilli bacterium]MBQ6282353.1 segregation/condensation protein A [Bacilli bacterium]